MKKTGMKNVIPLVVSLISWNIASRSPVRFLTSTPVRWTSLGSFASERFTAF